MTFERMVKLENLRPGGPRLAVFDGVDGIGAACYAIQNNAGKARVPSSAPVDFNACGPWSAVMAPSEFNNYALIKSLQFLEVAQNALVAALRS